MIDERLRKTVATALRVEQGTVTRELSLGQVERWDSLGHLRLILSVEHAFGVQFSTEEIPRLTTVGLIDDALKAKGSH
jgi:acyl carrier protein